LRGKSIGNKWGDWLNAGEETPVEYIDICYHALDAHLMSEMAGALGRKDEAELYGNLFNDIRQVFQKEYLTEGATLRVETQTAHALALAFALVPPQMAKPLADSLAAKIERNGFRMATGFLGTKPLLPVLSTMGYHDLAMRLFQSREFPSWGYEVVNGATTIWERWDSFTKKEGFGRHNAAMNSFSHYAFGAVCEWMFRFLAGIDEDDGAYARLRIEPGSASPGSNPAVPPIDWLRARYDSPRGAVETEWRRKTSAFEMRLEIPANTTATVYLPAASREVVREEGKPLEAVQGVKFIRMDGGRAVLQVDSGRYEFSAELP
jgi:alpha-L-rhamnosidase